MARQANRPSCSSASKSGNYPAAIEAPVVTLDNESGVMVATGPGIVRFMQMGAVDEGPGTPVVPSSSQPRERGKNDTTRQPPPSPKAEVMWLTVVKFGDLSSPGRLLANNNTHMAVFNDMVEAVRIPANNPDIPIDLDKLPPGGMYMHCDQLKVRSREENGRTSQEMEARSARGKEVYAKARDYWACPHHQV